LAKQTTESRIENKDVNDSQANHPEPLCSCGALPFGPPGVGRGAPGTEGYPSDWTPFWCEVCAAEPGPTVRGQQSWMWKYVHPPTHTSVCKMDEDKRTTTLQNSISKQPQLAASLILTWARGVGAEWENARGAVVLLWCCGQTEWFGFSYYPGERGGSQCSTGTYAHNIYYKHL